MLLALSACERRGETAQPPPGAASQGAAVSAIKPQSGNLPASSAIGPADGATAIGGMVAGPGGGKAATGGAPAPTGGDGAASAASAAAAK